MIQGMMLPAFSGAGCCRQICADFKIQIYRRTVCRQNMSVSCQRMVCSWLKGSLVDAVIVAVLFVCRNDDIQTKAARAISIFVADAQRRSLVCIMCWFISNFEFVVQ